MRKSVCRPACALLLISSTDQDGQFRRRWCASPCSPTIVPIGGYGSAEMLGWLVDERGIEPHVKVFDKSERKDGTFSRSDFAYDAEANVYVCPGGKELKKYHLNFSKPRDGLTKAGTLLYFAKKHDCDACALKPKCCPNMPARKIGRSIHEAARDKARAIAKTAAYATSRRERKRVEMLFAHLKRIPQARPATLAGAKRSQR